MTGFFKIAHWCGMRVSDLGEAIFNLGGTIECWADDKIYKKEQAKRIKQWQEWTGMPVIDVPLGRFADFSPADLALPNPDTAYSTSPLIMLDEYNGLNTKQVYDKMLTEEEYYEAKREYEEWLAHQHKEEE